MDVAHLPFWPRIFLVMTDELGVLVLVGFLYYTKQVASSIWRV